MADCRACRAEAELATEKVPHPVWQSLHTCLRGRVTVSVHSDSKLPPLTQVMKRLTPTNVDELIQIVGRFLEHGRDQSGDRLSIFVSTEDGAEQYPPSCQK
mgnify:FL=1